MEEIRHFSDADTCLEFVAALRWPDGQPVCPHCEEKGAYFLKTRSLWKCKACRKQFSVKKGTIFEDSPIGLDKWLSAIWLIANAKNGISSHELARAVGVTQKTAWFMLHRIRLAMQAESFERLEGEVEVDETFIGGQARYMHTDKKKEKIKARGPAGKAVVIGLLERHHEVRTKPIPHTKKDTVQGQVRDNGKPGSEVFTDALASYEGLDPEYVHQVINHAECYAKGNVHTNCMENFWSLLKRGIKGTYISVEPFHLFRYLDEQAFRFDSRKENDAGRFIEVGASIVGRRLTYQELIGDNEVWHSTAKGAGSA